MPPGRIPPAAPPGGAPPLPFPGTLFDVYIVGGERLAPAALLKVAGLIASRYQVAALSVADGLTGGRCLVGKRLADGEANRLAEELGDLGAQTEAVAAGAPPPDNRSTPAKSQARRTPPPPARDLASAREGGREHFGASSRAPRFLNAVLQDPLKRAFAGLALVLVIGFIPAAYYSFGINGAEVRRIRARQLELSAQPGSKPVIDEFDRLEAAIAQVRRRGLVQTGILWVLVSGIAGAGLSRMSALAPGRDDRASPTA
jgi:hypothetical protein